MNNVKYISFVGVSAVGKSHTMKCWHQMSPGSVSFMCEPTEKWHDLGLLQKMWSGVEQQIMMVRTYGDLIKQASDRGINAPIFLIERATPGTKPFTNLAAERTTRDSSGLHGNNRRIITGIIDEWEIIDFWRKELTEITRKSYPTCAYVIYMRVTDLSKAMDMVNERGDPRVDAFIQRGDMEAMIEAHEALYDPIAQTFDGVPCVTIDCNRRMLPETNINFITRSISAGTRVRSSTISPGLMMRSIEQTRITMPTAPPMEHMRLDKEYLKYYNQ